MARKGADIESVKSLCGWVGYGVVGDADTIRTKCDIRNEVRASSIDIKESLGGKSHASIRTGVPRECAET